MSEADLDDVLAIEHAAYAFPWTRMNFHDSLRDHHLCEVAILQGSIVAYWLMMRIMDEGHLLNCCVAPAWQRQGLGRQIMARVFAAARSHALSVLFLEVRPSNTAAMALYRSLGFTQVGRRRAYYPAQDGREDALIMKCVLEPAA